MADRILYHPIDGELDWFEVDDETQVFVASSNHFDCYAARTHLLRTSNGVWIRYEEGNTSGPVRRAGETQPYRQINLQQAAAWFTRSRLEPPDSLFDDLTKEKVAAQAVPTPQRMVEVAITPPPPTARHWDAWGRSSLLGGLLAAFTLLIVLSYPTETLTWVIVAGVAVFVLMMTRHPDGWYRRTFVWLTMAATGTGVLPTLAAEAEIRSKGRISFNLDNAPWFGLGLLVLAGVVLWLDPKRRTLS